jgi:hypothetical protein
MDLEGFEGLEGFDGVCDGVWEGDGVDIGVELDELDDMIVFECVELVWSLCGEKMKMGVSRQEGIL